MSKSQEFSCLSDKAILRHITEGTIVISPFNRAHLSTSSYDVTLGQYFFRESMPEAGQGIYNPYSENMVKRVWGEVCFAELHSEWSKRNGIILENVSMDDRIIFIKPGETILGHTNEFIGGRGAPASVDVWNYAYLLNKVRVVSVTTMMKARSSLGRNFIEVCKCAGWGDVGYVNRWTMEITNNSKNYSIPLVVGRRVAQIVFFDTEGIEAASYEKAGKYQSSDSLEELQQKWTPQAMLPKMYLDREVTTKT